MSSLRFFARTVAACLALDSLSPAVGRWMGSPGGSMATQLGHERFLLPLLGVIVSPFQVQYYLS